MESVRVKTYLSSRLASLSLKLMSKHSLCALVPNRILETGFGWGRKFSSVTQSYPTLCNPMDFSTPVLPVHYQLLESIQTQSVIPSNHLILCHLLPPSIFPSIRVFSNESALHSGGQSIRVSASTSVLPMNIQDWFHLGWTGWISLQTKGRSRIFSNTTVQKHQFFGAQLSW